MTVPLIYVGLGPLSEGLLEGICENWQTIRGILRTTGELQGNGRRGLMP